MSIAQQTLLITGAAGGLGAAVTAHLLATGARIIACDRSDEHLHALKQRVGTPESLHVISRDLSSSAAVAGLFDELADVHGELTGVAHLVGGYHGGTPVGETSDAIWDNMIDLNLRGAFLVVREAILRLRGVKAGSIVVVSSAAALPGAAPAGAAAYAVSKAGLNALVETAAAELRTQGPRINAVLPGMMRTRANVEAMPDAPHHLWVAPEEVAETIGFLLSPASSGVTGALIKVPGRL